MRQCEHLSVFEEGSMSSPREESGKAFRVAEVADANLDRRRVAEETHLVQHFNVLTADCLQYG